jgi:hypothetical protein
MPKTRKAGRWAGRSGPDAIAYEISDRVARQASTRPYWAPPGAPLTRPLRVFTFDPSVSPRIGGIATVNVPFEDVEPGPVGSIFEIDPTGAPPPLQAGPLDLDHPHLLLSDGLTPSPANGQFHLQQVYAVCSLTYAAFRRALGRDIAWAGAPAVPGGRVRLRVRPFAFQGKNAFYDRESNGLSFGYYRAGKAPAGHTVPGGLVFAGLSHDIVAHETTHALLDGLRAQFHEPGNADVLGFHEGFADLVALFLHFTHTGVLERAIRDSRGALAGASLLTDLAREFGYAASSPERPAATRSAVDVDGVQAFDSDVPAGRGRKGPKAYRPGMEEHELGSLLVSAVFEAFTTVFRRKIERLLRIAGLAPGDLGRAELGDELGRALAETASLLAEQFLNVCIRAVDYCPPVDMGMGEYLRALITADAEVVPDDKWGYREALMRSFRRRLLFPDHVFFMTEDAVKWSGPGRTVEIPDLAFEKLRFDGEPGRAAGVAELERQARALGRFVTAPENASLFHLFGPGGPKPEGVEYVSPPRIESIRCARRVSPDGPILFDLIAEVLQGGTVRRGNTLFDFSGGATIVIDPFGRVRYVIYKKLDSVERQDQQFQAMRGRLKRYWRREGRRQVPVASLFRVLHGRRQ